MPRECDFALGAPVSNASLFCYLCLSSASTGGERGSPADQALTKINLRQPQPGSVGHHDTTHGSSPRKSS